MCLTVGSLVLYEADPLCASLRGDRLVGVVLEDLGPQLNATDKQYKVRVCATVCVRVGVGVGVWVGGRAAWRPCM